MPRSQHPSTWPQSQPINKYFPGIWLWKRWKKTLIHIPIARETMHARAREIGRGGEWFVQSQVIPTWKIGGRSPSCAQREWESEGEADTYSLAAARCWSALQIIRYFWYRDLRMPRSKLFMVASIARLPSTYLRAWISALQRPVAVCLIKSALSPGKREKKRKKVKKGWAEGAGGEFKAHRGRLGKLVNPAEHVCSLLRKVEE